MNDKLPITLLYVEDEPDLRERIRIVLEMYVTHVIVAANGKEGLELFTRHLPDIVVSDIKMPVMDGLGLTKNIRTIAPDTPVILTTAFTETEYLLKAIELGVAAYSRKPLDCRALVETITRAATPILQKVALAKAKKRGDAPLELLLGDSPAMRDVIQQAQRIAETDFSVLILGETGVGKSHLAALIHGLSQRRHNPFITVTVGSMPESLVESQLFGHIKGAFTGAVSSKNGLFEEARGGHSFSMTWIAPRRLFRPKFCMSSNKRIFIRLAAQSGLTWIPASFPRATMIFFWRHVRGIFGRIFTTVSATW